MQNLAYLLRSFTTGVGLSLSQSGAGLICENSCSTTDALRGSNQSGHGKMAYAGSGGLVGVADSVAEAGGLHAGPTRATGCLVYQIAK